MPIRPLSLSRRARPASGDRGVLLILAIFATALLTVLAVAITAAVRVELLASRSSLNRMQALFLAQAGMAQARAVLFYDDPTVDTLLDSWGPGSEDPLDLPHEVGDGYYRVRIYDACGRVDINTTEFPALLQLTQDPVIAWSIIDWRDEEDSTSPEGAEWDYYESLPHPYSPRNGPFQTVGELLLVRGVTPGVFFSDQYRRGLSDLATVYAASPNRDAEGNIRINLNEFHNWGEQAFRDAIMARLGGALSAYDASEIWRGLSDLYSLGQEYTSLGQLSTVAGLDATKIAAVLDYVTVESGLFARGKVNVNTAPPEVLAALPGSSWDLAEAIVAQREVQPFQSLGEVVALMFEQPAGMEVFDLMVNHVTTKSSTFIIESMGVAATGREFRTLRALVRRDSHGVLVLQQREEDWPLPPPDREESLAIARR